jgi:amino acid transporter
MLAASRQSFALYVLALTTSRKLFESRLTFVLSARDGALPFSSVLYRMNKFTKTPVNTVWFCAAGSISLGALVFAGTQAINAVFSISITAQYVAFSIPIAVRWIWRKENGWTPGAFSLGAWVSAFIISNLRMRPRR